MFQIHVIWPNGSPCMALVNLKQGKRVIGYKLSLSLNTGR